MIFTKAAGSRVIERRLSAPKGSRNSNLLMSWPVIVDLPAYQMPAHEAYFGRCAQAFRALGFKIVNENCDAYFLPLDMMLDGNFHADFDGAKMIGRQLALDLRKLGGF